MRFTLVLSLILAILAVVFALQNPGVTDVEAFGLAYTGSKALVLLVTFAIGVLVGVLATVPAYFRNRRRVSSLQKTIAEERSEARRRREHEDPPQQTRERRTTEQTEPPPETPPPSSPSSESSSSESSSTR